MLEDNLVGAAGPVPGVVHVGAVQDLLQRVDANNVKVVAGVVVAEHKVDQLARGEEEVCADGGRVGQEAGRPLREVGVDGGDVVVLRELGVEKVSVPRTSVENTISSKVIISSIHMFKQEENYLESIYKTSGKNQVSF